MIDHMTLTVRDLPQARTFYETVLATLGYQVKMTFGDFVGFGDQRKPYFWLRPGEPSRPMHIAFAARDRAAVDAFHRVALGAGASDDGAPGPRPHYHQHYYGCFVVEPEGHHIEAVCHRSLEELAGTPKRAARKAAPKAKAKAKAKPKAKARPGRGKRKGR